MRVLIAGCGYVGSALATHLVAEGHVVHGLRRNVSALPPGVLGVAADLTLRSTLTQLPEVDALVYCAAADGRKPESYEAAYLRGLENVLDALASSRIERALFTSSTAVYAQEDGSQVDERSPTQPTSFSGQIVLRAEKLLSERLGERGVALRLAGIYGPTRTRLVRSVALGTAEVPPAARFANRIHLADCAGALAHLLTLPAPAPVYLGVDDDPAPLLDVMTFIAERVGVTLPPAGALVAGDAQRGAAQDAAVDITRRSTGNNKRCSNALLRASGYELLVPSYREGYPAICAEYLASAGVGT